MKNVRRAHNPKVAGSNPAPLLGERVLELEILEPFFLPMSPWLFHQACFGVSPR